MIKDFPDEVLVSMFYMDAVFIDNENRKYIEKTIKEYPEYFKHGK